MSGRLQAIDQAYLDNLRYFRPDAGGATVVYAGPRSDGGITYDVLAVTPPNGSELDLWLDPRTHLIARETADHRNRLHDDPAFELPASRRDNLSFREQHANVERKLICRARLVAGNQYGRCRTHARTGSKRARLLDCRRGKARRFRWKSSTTTSISPRHGRRTRALHVRARQRRRLYRNA